MNHENKSYSLLKNVSTIITDQLSQVNKLMSLIRVKTLLEYLVKCCLVKCCLTKEWKN